MRVVFATVVELVIWAICFVILPLLFSHLWGLDPSSPGTIVVHSWGASMVGLLLARMAGDKICKANHRPHACMLIIGLVLMIGDIVVAPLWSSVTWSRLGSIVALIVEWNAVGLSFGDLYRRRGR